jgi:phosphatidylserine/phosphatidylglycerophosphate/cardiolipin synthase-like enzyme
MTQGRAIEPCPGQHSSPCSQAVFAGLDPASLEALAEALTGGRLRAPFTAPALRRLVSPDQITPLQRDLSELADKGLPPAHVAIVLRSVAAERHAARREEDRLELVWSGPPAPGPDLRDTATVVRTLCRSAERSVLVANFAFDRPHTDEQIARARALWQPLAERMSTHPDLQTRMIVNISPEHDERVHPGDEARIVRRFRDSFIARIWPGARVPQIFYDPRGVHPNRGQRAIMHAKCIVIDDRALFLSSANFTHAAQERNIEAGVVIERPALARQISAQFAALITAGALAPLPPA